MKRLFLIVAALLFSVGFGHAACTGDQIQKMIDAGFSKSEINELCNSGPKFPQRWEMEEGSQNFEWQGYWLVNKDGSFTGIQRKGAATMNNGGSFARVGKRVIVSKTSVTDGNTCLYEGTVNKGQVTGIYYCKSGGPYNWRGHLAD